MATIAEMLERIGTATEIASKTPGMPEKKLRELVSDIWEQYIKEKRIHLNLTVTHELSLANGRADTVFNKLILEYKKPHTISSNNDKNRKLISQVQGYILDVAKEHRFNKERLLGVVFDGSYFLFMRYGKSWRVDDPLPVNAANLQTFLLNLEKLTAKKALIPENLIRDFAIGKESKNKVAADCVRAFYNEIALHGSSGDTKVHVFFEQWKIQYAEVHGSLEQKKINNQTLFTSYGFSKKEQANFNEYAFFFSLDTYYALMMKLLSYQVVGFYTMKNLTGVPLEHWKDKSIEDMKDVLAKLEEGGIFRELGIRNYLEGDLFSWYIQAWQTDIYNAVRQLIDHLDDYDPQTMEIAPDETRDILKKLYQYLVPREIRHDLGEYYTPDWLAERCLNQLMYNGDPKHRILDPGCGSGTFPILAIKRAKKYSVDNRIPPNEALNNILRSIFGFDLNPMAVISSRTNYLLAIADLLKYKEGEITIPIYLCDSVLPPEGKTEFIDTIFPAKLPYSVKTSVGNFEFSHSIVDRQNIQDIAFLLEEYVKKGISTDEFLARAKQRLELDDVDFNEAKETLSNTYNKLLELDQRGINGIWARIIKNAFAPLFVGTFDFIVGNPPWVNWDSLPENYRNETKPLWVKYGLFSLSGQAARLGGGKKDLSMLMTYVSIDKYLKDRGKLCFVITQSLFKTEGAGAGFRKFMLEDSKVPFKILQVDDMVSLQPFEGASNRTSVFIATKGEVTTYPVSYYLWKKKGKGRIQIDAAYNEVFDSTTHHQHKAKPISNPTSPWITGKGKTIDALLKIIKHSDYQAFAGVYNGGVSGVYWISVLERIGSMLRIENLHESGKIKVPQCRCEIEDTLVYPFLRWGDMSRWKYDPEGAILMTQDVNTRMGIDERVMTTSYPKTYSYLKQYENILLNRKSSSVKDLMSRSAFYAMFSVSHHSYSKYKVCWQTMVEKLRSVVVESSDANDEIYMGKCIIPQHTITFIPTNDYREAHYICAVMNSSVSDLIARSYSMGKSFGNPHLMNYIPITKYDSGDRDHYELSQVSIECHAKARQGIDISDLEESIDILVASIWGINAGEMKDIVDSLSEM